MRANNDFSDWISPIVVKELRQGLRSRSYMVLFMGLQALMVLFVATALAEDFRNTGAMFWVVMFVVLVLVLPSMAMGALHEERRENKLELLLLTRISSRGFIWGKWASYMLMGILLVVAILPYVVLRYYAGGVDFVEELGWLALMVLASGLLTAIGLTLSAIRNAILRWFAAFLLGFLSLMMFGMQIGSIMGSMDEMWLLIIVIAIPGLFIILEIAVSIISPIPGVHYENHRQEVRLEDASDR